MVIRYITTTVQSTTSVSLKLILTMATNMVTTVISDEKTFGMALDMSSLILSTSLV